MRPEKKISDAKRLREAQADRRVLTIAIVACVFNGIVVLAMWHRRDAIQWTALDVALAWFAFAVGVAIWQFLTLRCSFEAIMFTLAIAVAAFFGNLYVLACHIGSA